MGLIGNEIIQSRVWVDPVKTPPPDLNYKHTFPITVFDAVRQDMTKEDSPTLTTMLDKIFAELKSKQPIIPGKPANTLMTFAGSPGAVGAIGISQNIPWNPTDQRHDKIPTEKAVGELLLKLGIVNPDGSINGGSGSGTLVRWSDIIGRPNVYPELGMNEDGFITQKGVTVAINSIDSHLVEHEANVAVKFDNIQKKIDMHTSATNPHNVTAEQVGAISKALFDFHISEDNPHGITKTSVGLGLVDNTADIDKPISKATQEALDSINDLLGNITTDVGGIKYVINIEYNQSTGTLTWVYNDKSTLSLSIPIDGLIDEIRYDSEMKELVINELGGNEYRISISDLFVRYIGSTGTNILVEIDGDQSSGEQIIRANIVPKSITSNEMSDDSVTTRILKDQSVTGGKIKDLTITTIKYANGSITTEKIAELSITNSRLDNRAVDGRTLFSSNVDNRILAVKDAGSDPSWVQVVAEMISRNAVHTEHILNGSVTSDKLGNKSVITARIDDGAITNEKLSVGSVTNEKISNNTISGAKLVENPEFLGIPKITKRPDPSSNTNEIPDTRWVKDHTRDIVITNSNLDDRIVDGRSLFTSSVKDRVLTVLKANNDPVWGLVNNGMMDVNAVDTKNIKNLAITSDKIHDKSIESRHMTSKAVLTDHIADNVVTSKQLFKSDTGNMVLAALTDNSNPVYTKINQAMMANNSVGTLQLKDRNVTLSKIQSSDENQRILAVSLRNTDPMWVQASNKMIADRAVDGRTLFTSSDQDMVLGVTTAGVDPSWIKINSNMIADNIIQSRHISEGSITNKHLQGKVIDSSNIMDWSIKAENLAPGIITGAAMIKSPYPNRVWGVSSVPYSDPKWVQINTDMIEDLSITKEKIFQSRHPYRVLAATQAGTPPEYTMITHQFIVDGTINPNKLEQNFVLHGTPELTSDPLDDADNYQLTSTRWVRKIIASTMKDFNPEILFDTIDSSMIQDHCITGDKLMTSKYGPRVLGVTAAGADVEFLLIEEGLIANGAVTTNKIQRDLHLLGNPVVEVRPSPQSSDATGLGQLIPDCQWVLDRIKEASIGGGGGGGTSGPISLGPIEGDIVTGIVDGTVTPRYSEPFTVTDAATGETVTIGGVPGDIIRGILDGTVEPTPSGSITIGGNDGEGGTGGGELLPDSIITEYLMNRSVTAEKLFSTEFDNRVLAVLEPNTDPQYVKITKPMLEDSRLIDANRFFTSDKDNMILGVKSKGTDASWMKITNSMLEDNIIKTDQLIDRCVTADKLANSCITSDKLSMSAMIQSLHIIDGSITTEKILDKAVENTKIAEHTITGDKIAHNTVIPAYTTVATHTDYERSSIRNTVLSPNAPTGGENGLIWFRYI